MSKIKVKFRKEYGGKVVELTPDEADAFRSLGQLETTGDVLAADQEVISKKVEAAHREAYDTTTDALTAAAVGVYDAVGASALHKTEAQQEQVEAHPYAYAAGHVATGLAAGGLSGAAKLVTGAAGVSELAAAKVGSKFLAGASQAKRIAGEAAIDSLAYDSMRTVLAPDNETGAGMWEIARGAGASALLGGAAGKVFGRGTRKAGEARAAADELGALEANVARRGEVAGEIVSTKQQALATKAGIDETTQAKLGELDKADVPSVPVAKQFETPEPALPAPRGVLGPDSSGTLISALRKRELELKREAHTALASPLAKGEAVQPNIRPIEAIEAEVIDSANRRISEFVENELTPGERALVTNKPEALDDLLVKRGLGHLTKKSLSQEPLADQALYELWNKTNITRKDFEDTLDLAAELNGYKRIDGETPKPTFKDAKPVDYSDLNSNDAYDLAAAFHKMDPEEAAIHLSELDQMKQIHTLALLTGKATRGDIARLADIKALGGAGAEFPAEVDALQQIFSKHYKVDPDSVVHGFVPPPVTAYLRQGDSRIGAELTKGTAILGDRSGIIGGAAQAYRKAVENTRIPSVAHFDAMGDDAWRNLTGSVRYLEKSGLPAMVDQANMVRDRLSRIADAYGVHVPDGEDILDVAGPLRGMGKRHADWVAEESAFRASQKAEIDMAKAAKQQRLDELAAERTKIQREAKQAAARVKKGSSERIGVLDAELKRLDAEIKQVKAQKAPSFQPPSLVSETASISGRRLFSVAGAGIGGMFGGIPGALGFAFLGAVGSRLGKFLTKGDPVGSVNAGLTRAALLARANRLERRAKIVSSMMEKFSDLQSKSGHLLTYEGTKNTVLSWVGLGEDDPLRWSTDDYESSEDELMHNLAMNVHSMTPEDRAFVETEEVRQHQPGLAKAMFARKAAEYTELQRIIPKVETNGFALPEPTWRASELTKHRTRKAIATVYDPAGALASSIAIGQLDPETMRIAQAVDPDSVAHIQQEMADVWLTPDEVTGKAKWQSATPKQLNVLKVLFTGANNDFTSTLVHTMGMHLQGQQPTAPKAAYNRPQFTPSGALPSPANLAAQRP